MFTRSPYHAAARGLAGLALAAAFLVAHPPGAGAVLVPQDGQGSTGTAPQVPHCNQAPPATWPEPPRVVIHTKGLTDAPVSMDPARIPALLTQAKAAAAQIGSIGASSAKVGTVSTTSDAKFRFYSTTFGDTVPTIHVGFVSHATITADNDGKDADGLTTVPIYMSGTCVPTVTIEFAAESDTDWSLSTPSDLGVNYFSASSVAPSTSTDPGTWFRPSFLHEMLHAFGLQHTKTAYAMMNHRGEGFPWTSRAGADTVRPLPDDVRRLRASYPTSGAYWDVDATNSWYQYTDSSKGDAADQTRLCTPSVGLDLVQPEVAEGACGKDGPDAGASCARPGETLATRYALNNYSTGSERVTSTLSFSKDKTWDATDAASTTSQTDDLDATSSTLAEHTWSVPGETGSNLHPIVHLFAEHVGSDGSIDPSSMRIFTIPLRGTIDISRYCS